MSRLSDLDLQDSKKYFCMASWFIKTHHHTTFGYSNIICHHPSFGYTYIICHHTTFGYTNVICHYTKFRYTNIICTEDPDKHSVTFRTIAVTLTLTLNRAEKSSLQLPLTYHLTMLGHKSGKRGQLSVRATDSWSKGLGFESWQERRDNFLLCGQLSVPTLISVSVAPSCYRSSTEKIPVILPMVTVAGFN